ncbi:MAG: hypothetical protein ACEQR8_04770 [Cypionkella sp.]
MRTVIATMIAGSAVLLAACSQQAEDTTVANGEPAGEAAAAQTGATPAAADGAVLDPNSASEQQLAAAGMTPELAKAIVAGRPYASASAFNARLLESATPQQAETIRAAVFVPINLNSASEADIKLIPGMSEKMVHEFLEYRPYENMAEFDREIGKYVDEAEVARLRRYVTL